MEQITIKTIDEIFNELKKENITFSTKYSYIDKKKTKNKSAFMSLGRILFNLVLPEDYILIDKPVDGGVLKSVLSDIIEKYPPEIVAKTITDLNKIGFRIGTISPVSFSEDTFIVPDYILEKKKQLLKSTMDPIEIQEGLLILGQDLLEHFNNTKDPAYDLIMSKAKTSKINPVKFATLVIAKGISVGMEGIPSDPILNSSSDGFNLEEFYANASEARSGLFTRSSGAALPGALARDCVYANSNIKLEKGDCGTKRYLELYVTDKMSQKIVGRFYINPKTNALEEIKENNTLTNKTIKIRSPLHCISGKGVCSICYGKLGEVIDTEHVGVLVGGVINELLLGGVAMATRHNSGDIKLGKVNFNKDIIKI